MHTAALIASINKLLIATNARLTRKQVKKRSYIASGGVLTGEEGAELAELPKAKGNKKARKKSNKVMKSGKDKQPVVGSTSEFLNWICKSVL
jgi:hypothetical protein